MVPHSEKLRSQPWHILELVHLCSIFGRPPSFFFSDLSRWENPQLDRPLGFKADRSSQTCPSLLVALVAQLPTYFPISSHFHRFFFQDLLNSNTFRSFFFQENQSINHPIPYWRISPFFLRKDTGVLSPWNLLTSFPLASRNWNPHCVNMKLGSHLKSHHLRPTQTISDYLHPFFTLWGAEVDQSRENCRQTRRCRGAAGCAESPAGWPRGRRGGSGHFVTLLELLGAQKMEILKVIITTIYY